MTLEELIRDLVENQGLSEAEAIQIATATIKARRGSGGGQALSKTSTSGIPSRRSQSGEESAEEAEARWREQEMQDPQGIYSGGATAGGVFGDGVIAMSDYDPTAIGRTMQVQAQVASLRAQQETLRLLQQMQQQLPGHRPQQLQEPEPERRPVFNRFLGRKRRDE